MEFKVGDRVILTGDFAGGEETSIPKGMTGTICEVLSQESSYDYGVSFDLNFIDGHDCDGYADDGCGWYVYAHEIALDQDANENDVEVEANDNEEEDYDEIIPIDDVDHTTNDYQEEKKMENTINNTNAMNMFGIECGMNQDQNINSTIFGVAVKVGDSWRAFDKKNRSIQNIGNISLGEFPVLLMPSKKVNVGDLIKDAGQYLYVTEVLANGNIKAISVEDGTISEHIPTQLIGGMKIFTKVVTLMDDVMDGKSDFGILMLMSCMSGGAPMDMNQMLPLMLLSDSNKGNEPGDDSDKLFKMMMLMSAMGGSKQNQMLPLLLMKSL